MATREQAPSTQRAGGPLSFSPVLVVIPARYAADRLPGKPLLDLGGAPMIVRVLERVRLAARPDRVLVATDDSRIAAAVQAVGGEVMMTDPGHRSGTDRVGEVVERLGWDGLIVNVQGDEPLLEPAAIDQLVEALAVRPEVGVATVAAPLHNDPQVPARVKVVFDDQGRALYFSRQPIPTGGPWWQHVGMYAFRAPALRWFLKQPSGALERAERLEQLRFLEGGVAITVVNVARADLSVDTPADLARVREILREASEGFDA